MDGHFHEQMNFLFLHEKKKKRKCFVPLSVDFHLPCREPAALSQGRLLLARTIRLCQSSVHFIGLGDTRCGSDCDALPDLFCVPQVLSRYMAHLSKHVLSSHVLSCITPLSVLRLRPVLQRLCRRMPICRFCPSKQRLPPELLSAPSLTAGCPALAVRLVQLPALGTFIR